MVQSHVTPTPTVMGMGTWHRLQAPGKVAEIVCSPTTSKNYTTIVTTSVQLGAIHVGGIYRHLSIIVS